MKLHILRHGHTNYNDLGLCNGDPARQVYLTPLGREQARLAAEELRPIPLERIYASQLPRTQETAQIINRFHHVAIEVNPAINDILSGCEDKPVSEYQAAIADDPLRSKVGDGESLLEYKKRIVRFIEWLKQQPYGEFVVVAHEETLRIVYGYFNQLSDEELPGLHFANCQILVFDTSSTGHRV